MNASDVMKAENPHRLDTEALIEAIWGPQAVASPDPAPAAAERAKQNRALAAAMEAYLRQYLADLEPTRD